MEEDKLSYEKFLSGDVKGFEFLVLKYKNNLINFLLTYIKDVDLAQDLAQDAFVEVYVYKERFRVGENFKTYLFTIGRNKAVDYIRKYGREFVNDELVGLEIEDYLSKIGNNNYDHPEGSLIQKEDNIMIHKAIALLKEDYQRIIYLINFEELTYKEAAKVMKKSETQIRVLIFRARKALGKVLKEGGFIYEK